MPPKERLGVVYIRALSPLIEHLKILRGSAHQQMTNDPHFLQKARNASQQAVTDIQAVETANHTLGHTLEAEAKWQTWKSGWTQVSAAGSRPDIQEAFRPVYGTHCPAPRPCFMRWQTVPI